VSDTAIIISLACGLPVIFVVGGLLSIIFSARGRASRALITMKTVPISELVDGARVKVIGKVTAPGADLSTSPASGREALCYEVAFRFLSGQTIRGPVRLAHSASFNVDDGTGSVHVQAGTARLLLDVDHKSEIPEEGAPEWLFKALRSSGYQNDPRNPVGRFELEEGIIEVGETVAVVGTVERDASGGRRLVGTEDAELIVSDDPNLHGAKT